jgi:hypothetical protein
MASMFDNPYQGSLGDLDYLKKGSRKGLDVIYKQMQHNLGRFGQRLDYLDKSTAQYTSNLFEGLDSKLGGIQDQDAADAVLTALNSGGPIDDVQRRDLERIATRGAGLYQGYAGQLGGAEREYQKGLRGLDKAYVKELKASAVREKQARVAELEENALGIASGLRTQGAMWDAQQQMMALSGAAINTGAGQAMISGRETPATRAAMEFAARTWGIQVGGWRASGSVPGSLHPAGRAADLMINSGAQGSQIAAYFLANAPQWGVSQIIWNGRIWTTARANEGWRRYTGPNPHTDHVHLSF